MIDISLVPSVNQALYALGLVIAGYVIAWLTSAILTRLVDGLRLRKKLAKMKLDTKLAGFDIFDIAIGTLWWLIVLVFLEDAMVALNIVSAGNFIAAVIDYIPSAFEGLLVLVVAANLAVILSKEVAEYSNLIAPLIKITVIYFGVVMALPLFGIHDTGILVEAFRWTMLSIAIGIGGGVALAIGLGLKDVVSDLGKENKSKIEKWLFK